jgi:ribonuclease HII|tara:strand:+ start:8508 stop:9212 length:705 start_codon:yes stop_codon:yes gene_type:complete
VPFRFDGSQQYSCEHGFRLLPKTARVLPDFSIETEIANGSNLLVAGVDEVGRGTLAGPVVAAAAILPGPVPTEYKELVNDSKLLSAAQREKAFAWLIDWCVGYGVGACTSDEIDSMGIVPATRQAMSRAIAELEPPPDHLLIDAVELGAVAIPQTSMIRADSRSQSAAAASIIAKVTRDKLMVSVFDVEYPGYGFAAHKGYGTAGHISALKKLGASPIHRHSFKPVAVVLGTSD